MRNAVGLLFVAGVAAATAWSFAPRPLPQFPATAISAERLQVNGLAGNGEAVIAVGELGSILLGDARGAGFASARVEPDRGAVLTRVRFLDAQRALAVGHDGVILASADGGRSWSERAYTEDSSDPWLDLWSSADGRRVLAVGSFGRIARSADGGASWAAETLPAMQEDTWHLYGIDGADDGRLMIAGESGTALRSSDGGHSWEKLASPYQGSFFGVLRLSADDWLLYGMRGHVFRSRDFGASWTQLPLRLPVSWFDAARAADGSVVLAGQGGAVVVSRDGGESFEVLRAGGMGSLAAVLPLDGALLVGGAGGVIRIDSAAAAAGGRP